MSPSRDVVRRLVLTAGLAGGFSIALLSGSPVRAGPVPHLGIAPEAATDARFAADQTELPLDASRPARVVVLRVPHAAEADRVAQVSSDDPSIVQVVHPARLLAGQTYGYLLLRPVAPGQTTLRLGDSTMTIRVVGPRADRPGSTHARAFGPMPEMLTPTAGAGVWGKMNVGAAYWRIPGEPSDSKVSIKLRVGEGASAKDIEPTWTSSPDEGPYVLCSFPVDFSDRGPGPCSLRPIRTDAAGVEHLGEPAIVQVVSPKPEAIVSGECETDYGLLPPNVIGPPKPPSPRGDPTASGGLYFDNASADPRFRFPLEVSSDIGAGWYQVVMTAGGDSSTETLPSIGIAVDESQRPITASAIAQPGWHRIAIGTPIHLEPGRHVIRCDFVNDFAARGTDRNLRLDRIEIARVASEPSGVSRRPSAPGDQMSPDPAIAAMAAPPAAGGGSGGGDAMMSMSAMGGPSAGSSSGVWPASARAEVHQPIHIAFERPLDGLPIAGEIEVRGTLWWENEQHTPPPEVALLINGREVQRGRSDNPRFLVPPETFRAGANTVQLKALTDSGFVVSTAPQHVTLPAELALPASEDHARISRRFSIYDAAWSPSITKSLKDNQGGEQRKSVSVGSSDQLALDLPSDLAGEFDVWVECRSSSQSGRRVELSLVNESAHDQLLPGAPVAARDVPSWADAHKFTPDDARPLTLAEGPKQLLITVPPTSGPWSHGKGDKTAVWIQGVRLVERTKLTTGSAPHVALAYPAESQPVFGADALVAEVADANALDSAEPIIDNVPSGLRFDIRHPLQGVGRIVVPLSLRGLAPGEHHVALRITDMRGKSGESAARTIRVADAPPAEGTTYDRAVMLLDRFAYGPDPTELGEILRLGADAYLQERLDAGVGDDLSDDAACDLAAVRLTNPRSGYDVARRAIQQSIATGNPVRNRFTLWAENHFSTWVRKDEAWRKADEHERFSDLGIARFYDLLAASATSPAMLRYLDQERSFAGRLNENYAREIMELHTLGVHGGYSQQDVTNLAHVLTGWTTARTALAAMPDATPDEDGLTDDFRFEPVLAENLSEFRDVFGYRFTPSSKQDTHERVLLALELLAAHPSTARFVCTKLADHYVGVPETLAHPELVDDLASTFTRSGGDMRQVLLTLSHHPAFWQAATARRLSHPTDYAFRLARTSGWMNPHEIGNFLDSSGRGFFERSTPDGYPELDTESMDSNVLLQRWKLAGKADYAMADGIPPNIRWTDQPIDAELGQRIVDILAIRLTGRLLGEESNIQALQVLVDAQPDLPARPEDTQRDAQIKTVATFIAQLPEANVR